MTDWIQHHRLLLESRENAHLFAFLERFGPEAEQVARRTYYEHGFANGKRAWAKASPASNDVATAVQILLRWVIGGLPAEEKVEWRENTERKVVLRSIGCAHMAAWRAAGVPTAKACDLYKEWVDGFIHAINPGIQHYKTSRVSAGDSYCEEVWELDADED